ncbi:MAG: hypothetical protein ACOYO1_19105 [Bacteroidales bacterium]
MEIIILQKEALKAFKLEIIQDMRAMFSLLKTPSSKAEYFGIKVFLSKPRFKSFAR